MANQASKKIVIATGTFPPEVSGQATFVSGLLKNLPEEIEAKVITYGEEKNASEKVFVVSRNFWRYFNYWRILKREVKDAKIIFAQDLVSSGLPAALAKRPGQKLIIRIGGDFLWEKIVNSGRCEVPFSRYYDQPKNLTEKFYLWIYRLVLKRADKIIFNSEWQKGIYQKVFCLSQNKITVIENPFRDIQKIASNISDEIIFAGRFIPVKNLKRLIEAFKQIKTDKKLVLIGEGPQQKELKILVSDDSRIKIEDKMNQEALWQRIRDCYLFILPSLSEMNPNAALEALNLHKVVILTQEVGLSEELKKHFRLIDPLSLVSIKTAIEYFLDSRSFDGLTVSTIDLPDYNWTKVIKKYLSVFNL